MSTISRERFLSKCSGEVQVLSGILVKDLSKKTVMVTQPLALADNEKVNCVRFQHLRS